VSNEWMKMEKGKHRPDSLAEAVEGWLVNQQLVSQSVATLTTLVEHHWKESDLIMSDQWLVYCI